MRDIGQTLQKQRVSQGLEISDIAKSTCICVRYLRAMEEGRFQMIPTVFDKGYLKIYAQALALDTQPLLLLYEQKKCQWSARCHAEACKAKKT